MPIVERAKALALSWGDSLLPPGPVRDKATTLARRSGITFAPPVKQFPERLRARHRTFNASQQEQLRAVFVNGHGEVRVDGRVLSWPVVISFPV